MIKICLLYSVPIVIGFIMIVSELTNPQKEVGFVLNAKIRMKRKREKINFFNEMFLNIFTV